jgi:signal transduction histidine kinase
MRSMGIRMEATHNRPGADEDADEDWLGTGDVKDQWDEVAGTRSARRGRSGSRSRSRSRSRSGRKRLTEQERAYRAARRRANLKLSFISHFVAYGTVCTFLLFVAGFRAAFVVALSWGIGIVFHYFFALVAPGLRHRLVEREVHREVEVNVSRERRTIEERNARQIEQLSASIAHEIRNPITAAKSLVQQMGEDPNSDASVGYANVALEELDRVERSISHLLRFAREEDVQMAEIQLGEVALSALETFRDRLSRGDIRVEHSIDTDGVMRGDAEKLRRVMINLIANALDAFDEAKTIDPTIEVTAGENLAGTEVWLRVRDNGPGMDPATLDRIFNPFFTSKASGTGLGLAISKKVIDAHGGSIEASSEPGSGSEFLLTFPKQLFNGDAHEGPER